MEADSFAGIGERVAFPVLPYGSIPTTTAWPFNPGQKLYREPKSERKPHLPQPATVLLVEANHMLRQGLQHLLEADGLRVLPAADGCEALEKMQQHCPDLILSDISMPRMDGYALFDEVRSRPEWLLIPFIFLASHGNRDDVIASKRRGAEDYLVKPVNRHELISAVKARLARSQELRLAQIQQVYQSSLILLANAIELRDRYTRGHVERVMQYALLIASRMGWSGNKLMAVQLGGILHDVGKIYLPETILRKPGRLDKAEWAEMKRHPELGADLLSSISHLASAIPVVRSHHERWDGLGYPDQLAGDTIPLPARIVAVADSLDAMTSHRSYHGAVPLDDARTEIIACSGTRYDPDVVRAFDSVFEEIKSRNT